MNETFDLVVTGGNSPLGDHVLPALLAIGAKVGVTARSKDAADQMSKMGSGCTVLRADLELDEHLAGAQAGMLLHLAGIRYAAGATRLATDLGVERIIAISSASATTKTHPLRESILRWEREMGRTGALLAILRPTMIYGSSRDRTIQRLYRLTQRLGRVPRVSGGGLVMPVLVDDVVSAIIETIGTKEPTHRPVAGPEPVRLGDIVDAICAATGAPRLPITISLAPVIKVAQWGGRRSGNTRHAVQMLAVDRVVRSPVEVGFSYEPTRLKDGIALALRRYSQSTPV